jgi:hypothetical protein
VFKSYSPEERAAISATHEAGKAGLGKSAGRWVLSHGIAQTLAAPVTAGAAAIHPALGAGVAMLAHVGGNKLDDAMRARQLLARNANTQKHLQIAEAYLRGGKVPADLKRSGYSSDLIRLLVTGAGSAGAIDTY